MRQNSICRWAGKKSLSNRATAARWRNYVAAWLNEPVTHFAIYRCKCCRFWHIGHSRKGRKQ